MLLGLSAVALIAVAVALGAISKRFLPDLPSQAPEAPGAPAAGVLGRSGEGPDDTLGPSSASTAEQTQRSKLPSEPLPAGEDTPKQAGNDFLSIPGGPGGYAGMGGPGGEQPVLWYPTESDFDQLTRKYRTMKIDPTTLPYASFVQEIEKTAVDQVKRSKPPDGTPLFPIPNPWENTKPVEKKDLEKHHEVEMLDRERRTQAVVWEYLTKGTIQGKTPDGDLGEKAVAMLARLKMLRATFEEVYKKDVPDWENVVIDDPLKPGDPRGPRGRDPSGFIPHPPHKD